METQTRLWFVLEETTERQNPIVFFVWSDRVAVSEVGVFIADRYFQYLRPNTFRKMSGLIYPYFVTSDG